MNFVKQNILHNPPEQNGNCFAAVIASITEIPIDEVLPVQNYFDEPGYDWFIRLFYWLRGLGWNYRWAPDFQLRYQEGRLPDYLREEMFKDRPYLVTGKTNRFEGKVAHVCIYMNGELLHDPHPENTGLTTLDYFEVIEKL